jgi:small subunit ribosomal protein S9
MAEQATVLPVEVIPQVTAKRSYVWGTGRRKTAVARVRIAPGSGKIEINGRTLNDYFTSERDRKALFGPLEVTNTGGKLDIWVNSNGGGLMGQAGAVVMGLSRALVKYDPTTEVSLRNASFLTRDSRMKERKKYGQRGARRRFQFSKR